MSKIEDLSVCNDTIDTTKCYHEVEELDTTKNISFQVKVFNKNVQIGSPWSDIAYCKDVNDNLLWILDKKTHFLLRVRDAAKRLYGG